MSRVCRNDKPFVFAGTVSSVDRPIIIKPIEIRTKADTSYCNLKTIMNIMCTICSTPVAIAMDHDLVAYENASLVCTCPTQSMLIDANTKKIMIP